MSFTFHEELGDDISVVRMLIGDTVDSGHKVEDESIEWALGQEGNVYESAALVAETLSSKFAAEASSITLGETNVSQAGLATTYSEMAARLRSSRRRGAVPLAFGYSHSDKELTESDTDREPIVSKKGGMDHPGTSREA